MWRNTNTLTCSCVSCVSWNWAKYIICHHRRVESKPASVRPTGIMAIAAARACARPTGGPVSSPARACVVYTSWRVVCRGIGRLCRFLWIWNSREFKHFQTKSKQPSSGNNTFLFQIWWWADYFRYESRLCVFICVLQPPVWQSVNNHFSFRIVRDRSLTLVQQIPTS
jgi:hypothetical protein